MEGLGLVETVAVGGPDLVSVLVLLSSPLGAVPQLGVRSVTGGQLVGGDVLELELGTVLETQLGVAGSPVGFGQARGAVVGSSLGGGEVVLRVVVGSVSHHGGLAISAAGGLQGLVVSWDQSGVETVQAVVSQ